MPEPDVLVTKITIPPLRSVLLPRSHLLLALEQSRTVPLTLLSASAGFGKTTLLAAWASQSTSQIAWLSLDEGDNDPTRFWASVIASLRCSRSRLAAVGEAALTLLHTPQPPMLTGALTSLINELAALGQDMALILDDYHLLSDPAIHDSLQFFLEYLPACLHVLLASRGDPPLALSRLRARGQLVEIRETDLCVRGEEAASFLTQVMGLALSAEAIQLLETRTEGWIAGLQLAALALRRHADRSTFLQTFRGSHRLILDYVQEEILQPLPEAQLRFLLHTSVLERMNAAVCQRLSGEPASQQMLEALERANLFLIPLDEERRWYRWHTLFREVLLARLQATQPQEVSRLHREAARWYQQQNWPHEAIPHALAAQDFAFVAEMLEGATERLFLQGEVKTLLTWIKLLPHEVLTAHPRLATSYIFAFNLLFPFAPQQQEERAYLYRLQEEVEVLVQGEEQTTLPHQERDRLRQRLMVLQAWNLGVQALAEGNPEQLSRLAEQMQHLSLDDDAVWQQQAWGSLAMAYRLAGNFPPMVALLQDMRKIAQRTHSPYQEAQALWGLMVALIALGQLQQARDHGQELQELVDRLGGPLPVAAYPDFFQAQLSYEWNQLDVAKRAAEIAIEKTTPSQYLDILIGANEVLARVYLAQGDRASAEQVVRELEQLQQSVGIALFRPVIDSLWVHLWLTQGHLTRAADWAEHTPYREAPRSYSREGAYLALVRVYLAEQRYPQALQLLTVLQSLASQVTRAGSMIAILALEVSTLQASGAIQEALPVLHRLLTLAEPEGYLRVFLDAGAPMHQALQAWLKTSQHAVSPALAAYAHRVFDAFASMQHQAATEQRIPLRSTALPRTLSQAASPLLEPLTAREQEVLRLLAEGATNQQIADHLVVSLTTVKKHVGSLLLKLAAENRTHAVARARELSLL